MLRCVRGSIELVWTAQRLVLWQFNVMQDSSSSIMSTPSGIDDFRRLVKVSEISVVISEVNVLNGPFVFVFFFSNRRFLILFYVRIVT